MFEKLQVPPSWEQGFAGGWDRFQIEPGWEQGWHTPWFGGMGGFLWHLLGMLFWIGLLVLIAVLLARLIFGGSRAVGGPPFMPRRDPALDIARERFARGEIDAPTFEAIKRALSSP